MGNPSNIELFSKGLVKNDLPILELSIDNINGTRLGAEGEEEVQALEVSCIIARILSLLGESDSFEAAVELLRGDAMPSVDMLEGHRHIGIDCLHLQTISSS